MYENNLIEILKQEIARQDSLHGPFNSETPTARARMGIACCEDELHEALEAWRDEKPGPRWFRTSDELIQLSAVALRAARDI